MLFHPSLRRAPLFVGLCLLFVFAAGGAARADSVISAFGSAVDALQDYTVTIADHEISGGRTQDRVVRYWYKRPNAAKIEVVSGAGRGGVAVWRGGDTLRGHQGGFLSMIKLTVGLHDPRATSLRGDTIDSASFAYELEHFKTTKGELAEAPGPRIEGVSTDTLTLNVADPSGNGGVSKDVLYISRDTHLPVKRERYQGETLVKSELFGNLKTNINLIDRDFAL